MTGIGPVAVRQPRVRDRDADAADPERIRFSPSILPPYMRRSKSTRTGGSGSAALAVVVVERIGLVDAEQRTGGSVDVEAPRGRGLALRYRCRSRTRSTSALTRRVSKLSAAEPGEL